MALLGWLWLGSPFVLIAVIAHDRELQKGIANNLGQARAAGCLGALTMVLGAVVASGALGATMYALGTPFVGLLAFTRRDDDDGGGEDGPEEPPRDWDDFERLFWAYVRRRQRQPRRPRSPSAA
jgi:hypothetical protein